MTRRDRAGPGWPRAAAILGGLLLVFYLIPLLALVTAQRPGVVVAQLDDPVVVTAAANSLATATTSTVIATLLGVPLAYWLARTHRRRRDVATAVVALPLVLPPIVSGILLLGVVGPAGIGSLAAGVGLPLTRSLVGVVLAQTFVASPFVVVTATAAFEGVDATLEHASRTLGKGHWTTFRRVTLPLAWPGIAAGVTLAFARSIGEFGATIMLAYYPRTMPVQIWVTFFSAGLDEAYPVAVVLLAISLLALLTLGALGASPWGWHARG